jgi:hypothetical protein
VDPASASAFRYCPAEAAVVVLLLWDTGVDVAAAGGKWRTATLGGGKAREIKRSPRWHGWCDGPPTR